MGSGPKLSDYAARICFTVRENFPTPLPESETILEKVLVGVEFPAWNTGNDDRLR
jgi:hypothetical protein